MSRTDFNLTIRLLTIQVGMPRTLGSPGAQGMMDRMWTTGFFKESICGPVEVLSTRIQGDGQADLKNHGGMDKAVCCYPKDHWPFWEEELGFTLPHGAFGENFTLSGCGEEDICIGDILTCGSAIFQVSQPRQPCWKLARRWSIPDLAARVERTGKTGWYFRVLQQGMVAPDSDLVLTDRPYPGFTVAHANEIMHQRKQDWIAAQDLASCSLLSESWRKTLANRVQQRMDASPQDRLSGEDN